MSMPFRYLISLEPLGLLYASSGRFLSAENLVGQAGEHFPPDSPAFAGLIAAQLPRAEVRDLHTAGPFWCRGDALYLPAPLNLLQDKAVGSSSTRAVSARLVWQASGDEKAAGGWSPASGKAPPTKPLRGGWVPLSEWGRQDQAGAQVHANPWKAVPHLHPRLRDDERVSAQEDALFMELAVALDPGVCLSYLSSHEIPAGRYRFGGEGHLVELRSDPVPSELVNLLKQPLSGSFSLVTPGLWGGSRLSLREPLIHGQSGGVQPWHRHGRGPAILTDRPRPWRHRLGGGLDGQSRLSRGRWAVPAGSCYHAPPGLDLPPWPDWPESWFPKEGFSFKQLGTGLALPLP
jgi:CRISPR-associated protein Cmr3